jgi:hypothetical protein
MFNLFKFSNCDEDFVISNFYHLSPPSEESKKQHAKKVKAIIEAMGNKYCLSKNVKKGSHLLK